MALYVDGYVVPVPLDRLAEYTRLARKCAKVWIEHGALQVVECAAEDVRPGQWTSFPQAVKLEEGETVVFSWIVYKSRRQRDAVNAKVMADPRLAFMKDAKAQPFDSKRMFWGGFRQIVAM
jgi:uncharacterized protein YbaA (DUF1428 family)